MRMSKMIIFLCLSWLDRVCTWGHVTTTCRTSILHPGFVLALIVITTLREPIRESHHVPSAPATVTATPSSQNSNQDNNNVVDHPIPESVVCFTFSFANCQSHPPTQHTASLTARWHPATFTTCEHVWKRYWVPSLWFFYFLPQPSVILVCVQHKHKHTFSWRFFYLLFTWWSLFGHTIALCVACKPLLNVNKPATSGPTMHKISSSMSDTWLRIKSQVTCLGFH